MRLLTRVWPGSSGLDPRQFTARNRAYWSRGMAARTTIDRIAVDERAQTCVSYLSSAKIKKFPTQVRAVSVL
jgi:hypothetical protein